MKHRIGKVVKPRKLSWLTEDKIDEYLKSMGWENLKNSVINGFIWTQYLNEYDYKNLTSKYLDHEKIRLLRNL